MGFELFSNFGIYSRWIFSGRNQIIGVTGKKNPFKLDRKTILETMKKKLSYSRFVTCEKMLESEGLVLGRWDPRNVVLAEVRDLAAWGLKANG